MSKLQKLSIVIPCYNEAPTILELLEKVEKVEVPGFEKEIIVIDDGSQDSSIEILKTQENIKLILNSKNKGKGYALKKGIEGATGDIILIQDADLEYNPENYATLLAPFKDPGTQVVYGSRERNSENKQHSGIWFYWGGLFLTYLTNALYHSKLTDQSTCYKVFRSSVLKSILLTENRFGFCSEVTVKLLKKGIKIKEVSIDYFPRKKSEGKKISWKDGVRAIYIILKEK